MFKVIDLTFTMRDHWRWPVKLTAIPARDRHYFLRWYMYFMIHCFTQVDAPLHYLEDGDSIEKVPLDRFMGEAAIVNLSHLGESTGVTAAELEKHGQPTRVLSAIEVKAICEPFIRRKCLNHLSHGRVAILAGGTGNPFVSTDTCAALRAAELDVDIIIKATKVDGVYDADPHLNPNAKRFETISYLEALNLGLAVMDSTALSLCMENQMPIVVLNLWQDVIITQH